MVENYQRAKYIVIDLITSALVWTLFYSYRKIFIERPLYGDIPLIYSKSFITGIIVIPIFWITLHYLAGYYSEVYRKSRLKELFLTISVSALGVIIIFFILLIDDVISGYKDYYKLLFVLFTLQFTITYFPRVIFTSLTIRKVRNKKLQFNTIIVGDNEKSLGIYREFTNKRKSTGNNFVGFICVTKDNGFTLSEYIPNLGKIEDLKSIIEEYNVKEVFLSMNYDEKQHLEFILSELSLVDVGIRAVPLMYDILAGKVKMSSMFGEPLMEINTELMTPFQFYFKRVFDMFFAFFGLLILSPLMLTSIFIIKISSKGPVIYKQDRIGQFGLPFKIYKFRSMYLDAEKSGPMLSSINDERITKYGKFMRKTRIDEIPNFINVLKGDMSIVGPRPERSHYIEQIVKKAPHYIYLQKVKPGVTSWGQVKYGYAENVDQMIDRLKYDLIYIENMSIFVDFKILIYTFITIFKGRGV